ncbi:multidrug effflux MFS transporter [Neptunicoccus cionae]|uniref:Bcr/CflA family efflux transporter n=1 Tax=Neptunicoccus cionae TaxID=2035344 RepID=A0A916QR84_9RHOB|nr:multidrug effflux MFS transporter [Amylibacter cionae]GGA05163.1 Bcr/CflA family drug resistance efflux transporter [Amylibacter cionae]
MFRIALILGLMSAVGPFAIDMYLPALPLIAQDLNASVAAVQGTITAFFLAFGLSQLVYGPWSDQVGRKVPIYVGLAIFVLGSIGCIWAPTIGWLTAFRFVQGLGAAVVMVLPRAIVRDLYTGNDGTRLMAMIMLVISVSPMLAPLAGSLLLLLTEWRAMFAVFVVTAGASLLMARFALPETLPQDHRVKVNAANLLRGCKILLTDRSFMALTLVGAFGMASFFVFIASGSFVYTGEFGLSPIGFSIAFAINAVGFFGASQMAAPIGERLGMVRVVRLAVLGFAASTLFLLAMGLAGLVNLYVMVGVLFCANGFLGLVIPTTMVLALEEHGDIAGLASSLGGMLQMMIGGLMVTLVGPFFDGTALPMIAAIAVCGVLALGVSSSMIRPQTLPAAS